MIPVKSAAVVGAGTMGGGIAMVLANAGIPVLLKEADQAALDRGLATIQSNYANSVKRGRFTQQVADERLKRITPTLTYDDFSKADLVIEAVFEGMALKKEVFKELDRVCKPGAILASNTSTLSIDEIASSTSRPEFVIGTHFFSPANVMRLLEIVRGKAHFQGGDRHVHAAFKIARQGGRAGRQLSEVLSVIACSDPTAAKPSSSSKKVRVSKPWTARFPTSEWPWVPWPPATLPGLDVGWRIRKEYRHLEVRLAFVSRLPKIVFAN